MQLNRYSVRMMPKSHNKRQSSGWIETGVSMEAGGRRKLINKGWFGSITANPLIDVDSLLLPFRED